MKMAVITGCDSGIGKSLTRCFADRRYMVIISYLSENPYKNEPGIIARKLDLRNPGHVNSFASFVKRCCKEGHSLDFFINNAGVAMGGPFENIPMEIYREVFEVNFFGLVSLTQRILPGLISSRGRLVVNGSMAGRGALPFLSPYTASKFAREGWCDSVRRELNPLGIRTILLEPGGVATPIWNRALEQDSSFADKKYSQSLGLFRDKFIAGGNEGMDTHKAASLIFRMITKKNPAPRCIISSSRILSYTETLIPDRVLDILVKKMFAMNYGGKLYD